jgi:hypothetical protein
VKFFVADLFLGSHLVTGVLLRYYGLTEESYYTCLFGVSRAIGTLCTAGISSVTILLYYLLTSLLVSLAVTSILISNLVLFRSTRQLGMG